MENKTQIVWFPKDYMYLKTKISPTNLRFCSSINKENMGVNTYSTFGSLFMRHYDIYFNRMKKQISFVRSECEDRSERAYPVSGIKKLVDRARVLVSSILGTWAGMFIVLFVMATLIGYAGYRFLIMRGWLAKTKGDDLLEKVKEIAMVNTDNSGKKIKETM